MSFYVYIVYTQSLDHYYVGHTDNMDDRLNRHNNSGSKSTKKAKDWVLKYSTRAEAISRETEIKKKKSRKHIEKLIASHMC